MLTIFVHGYNNSRSRALDRWEDDIWPGLVRLTNSPIDGVVLFFWPGDAGGRLKVFSAAQYPRQVQRAIDAGVELGRYIRRIADRNPGLQVQFVGHSLGCRVVLSAVNQLSEKPQTVPVARTLLMGAAVPVGDCKAPGPWREAVSKVFRMVLGQSIAESGEVVLHSRDDSILRKAFPLGEAAARRIGVQSFGPYTAVGLTGGPPHRWSPGGDCRGLQHDDYPSHPRALRYVASLFGPLADRPLAEYPDGEHFLDEQLTDERWPQSARS